ncbi:TBC1 domain family member 8 [Sciurus carolinensis]|uniref:TBC1 domain family member 8 n=1 Tax=Sciurus carolinensis TaxID=30640 RepID=A0AA41T680_SCICA|nr:TBC1 domain family member 8 [Sciurus carolinensis]
MGALEVVLDSNTEVAPFRVLLQVPGSQVYSPIACGEFLDGCDVHWAIATVQLVIPWVDIQKLERTSNFFVADAIQITMQNKERDSSMFLILDAVLKIMEQLVDVTLRRLLDNEVVSMEKMEDTSLLPSPILISIRSEMAIQFIELKDRETLVETLLERRKQVHTNHPVHYDTSTNDRDMGACWRGILFTWSPGPRRGCCGHAALDRTLEPRPHPAVSGVPAEDPPSGEPGQRDRAAFGLARGSRRRVRGRFRPLTFHAALRGLRAAHRATAWAPPGATAGQSSHPGLGPAPPVSVATAPRASTSASVFGGGSPGARLPGCQINQRTQGAAGSGLLSGHKLRQGESCGCLIVSTTVWTLRGSGSHRSNLSVTVVRWLYATGAWKGACQSAGCAGTASKACGTASPRLGHGNPGGACAACGAERGSGVVWTLPGRPGVLRRVRRQRCSRWARGSASAGHPPVCVSRAAAAASSGASWATCGLGPSDVKRGPRRKGNKPDEVQLKDALKLWAAQRSSDSFILGRRGGYGEGGGGLSGGPMGALEVVLDSNTEVAPFRVLLQVPGSQVYSPIACGELLDGCDVHWAIATVQLVIPWVDIQKLERTSNVFAADTIRITTQNKECDSSMFLIPDVVLKIMEQLVDVMLRRLVDNELWTPFIRFLTAGHMISSDSSMCFASREDGCYNVVLLLREVVSMEKMEDTILLPSTILISIRSKMAFQFIKPRIETPWWRRCLRD